MARFREFVAGREGGHAQATEHVHVSDTDRGDETQRGGREAGADGNDLRAVHEVLAAPTDVLSGTYRTHDDDAAVIRPATLLHHDGIGALGNGGPGEDARGAAWCERCADGAGRDALDDGQGGFVAIDIAATHGVTVHCAVVVSGDVDRGVTGHGQDALARRAERDVLGRRERMRRREQRRECLIDTRQSRRAATGVHHVSFMRGIMPTRLQGRVRASS